MSSPNSFTSLRAADRHQQPTSCASLSREASGRKGSGVPKFKSLPPPSLPISPPPAAASPFSYFGLTPAEFLDSPVLLCSSNISLSPTTGTFPNSNWKSDSSKTYQQEIKPEQNNYSNFSFQPNTVSTGLPTWYYQTPAKQDDLPPEKSNSNPEFDPIQQIDHYNKSSATINENKRLDDGYNWRKYGQKQVKGNDNPRSYYKCTHPSCPTKKKMERSLSGQITEIVYKGSHNHAKPQSVRRPSALASCSSAISASSVVIQAQNEVPEQLSEGSVGAGKVDCSVANPPENSSASVGDDEFDHKSKYGGDHEFDEDDEPDTKRWKCENGSENAGGMGSKTVIAPRVVVQTKSDIDILIDGYRWRKYGQKVVKGNPNPRSYYKCTSPACPVRKHVERASNDPKSVITTYEGRHNHDVPAPRGGGNHALCMPVPYNPSSNVARAAAFPVRGGRWVETEAPFTLEMLPSPAMSFRYSGFGNPMGSGIDLLQDDALFTRAKDEPIDQDMFLDSFLS